MLHPSRKTEKRMVSFSDDENLEDSDSILDDRKLEDSLVGPSAISPTSLIPINVVLQ